MELLLELLQENPDKRPEDAGSGGCEARRARAFSSLADIGWPEVRWQGGLKDLKLGLTLCYYSLEVRVLLGGCFPIGRDPPEAAELVQKL